MTHRIRRLVGAGLLLVAFGLGVLALRPIFAFQVPQPDRVDKMVQDADVFFEVSPSYIWLPTSCFRVTWRLSNIDAIWLEDDGRGGEDSDVVCGGPANFLVRFQNGVTEEYDLSPEIVIKHPGSLALALLLSLLIAWQGAFFLGVVPQSPESASRRTLGALFSPQLSGRWSRFVSALALVGLFALGVQHWLAFYSFGNIRLDTQDWRLTRSYWDTITYAIDTREIPFFTADDIAHTERFIGDPDPAWNPLLVFADRVTPAEFALINTLLLYAAGFVGLLLLKRRYSLSLVSFTVVFLLFNFNGFITSHLSVGHFTWAGYYGLPVLILYLLEMVERDDRAAIRAGLKTGVVIAVMALFGSFHMIVWWGWTLVIFGLFVPRRLVAVLVALGSAGLLSAYRYLPVAFAMSDFELDFRTGFPTLQYLLDGLTSVRTFDYTYQLESALDLRALKGLKWWEFDMFIGYLGFAFIFVFGVVMRFVRSEPLRALRYADLDMPIALMAAFSISTLFEPIFNMPLPFLNSERVTSRFFIVPLLLLVVVGAIRFERLLPAITRGLRSRLLVLVVLWQMSTALGLHSSMWQISRLEARFRELYPTMPDQPVIPLHTKTLDQGEWLYVLSLPAGIVITLIACVVWVVLYRRFRPVETAESA